MQQIEMTLSLASLQNSSPYLENSTVLTQEIWILEAADKDS